MSSTQTTVPVGELLQPALDDIERRSEGNTEAVSFLTGFLDLDALTGGLHPGELWVITGESGSGKSVLALDIARNLAVTLGHSVDLCLTRESPTEAIKRLLAAECRVGLLGMRTGALTGADRVRIAGRRAEVAQCKLRIGEVRADLALMSQPSPGADALVVDAVASSGLLQPMGFEVLRHNVLDRGTAVLIVMTEPRQRRRCDVEERLFQAADVVLEIYREAQDDPQSPRAGEADLIVRRNRFGPTATVTVSFQGHYSRFVDMRVT